MSTSYNPSARFSLGLPSLGTTRTASRAPLTRRRAPAGNDRSSRRPVARTSAIAVPSAGSATTQLPEKTSVDLVRSATCAARSLSSQTHQPLYTVAQGSDRQTGSDRGALARELPTTSKGPGYTRPWGYRPPEVSTVDIARLTTPSARAFLTDVQSRLEDDERPGGECLSYMLGVDGIEADPEGKHCQRLCWWVGGPSMKASKKSLCYPCRRSTACLKRIIGALTSERFGRAILGANSDGYVASTARLDDEGRDWIQMRDRCAGSITALLEDKRKSHRDLVRENRKNRKKGSDEPARPPKVRKRCPSDVGRDLAHGVITSNKPAASTDESRQSERPAGDIFARASSSASSCTALSDHSDDDSHSGPSTPEFARCFTPDSTRPNGSPATAIDDRLPQCHADLPRDIMSYFAESYGYPTPPSEGSPEPPLI